MRKRNNVAGKVPTHFETVPLEVVKEIAVEDVPTNDQLVAIEPARPTQMKRHKPISNRAPAAKKR